MNYESKENLDTYQDFLNGYGSDAFVVLTCLENAVTQTINNMASESLLQLIKSPLQDFQQAVPQQEPYGWMITGVPTVMKGSLAEDIQKAEAKRIGGNCKAFPIYLKGN